MPERALVPDAGRRPGNHRKLAARLQPGEASQLARISDPGGISHGLCKCGKQNQLPTFTQPRLRRDDLAAKLNREHSHLTGLNQEGSSMQLTSVAEFFFFQ